MYGVSNVITERHQIANQELEKLRKMREQLAKQLETLGLEPIQSAEKPKQETTTQQATTQQATT